MAPRDPTTSTPPPAPEGSPAHVVIVPPGGDTTFDAFYREHSGFVMKLLLLRKDVMPKSVEDLHQIIFERASKVIEAKVPILNPQALLTTITHNEICAYRRRWRPPVQEGRDPMEMASREASPEGAALAAERKAMLKGFLDQMPPEAAELILYVNVYGMTLPQVAEIRNVPVNTATSQHARARAKLKEIARAAGVTLDL